MAALRMPAGGPPGSPPVVAEGIRGGLWGGVSSACWRSAWTGLRDSPPGFLTCCRVGRGSKQRGGGGRGLARWGWNFNSATIGTPLDASLPVGPGAPQRSAPLQRTESAAPGAGGRRLWRAREGGRCAGLPLRGACAAGRQALARLRRGVRPG